LYHIFNVFSSPHLEVYRQMVTAHWWK